ncbi:VanZ family protein [Anaerobaca lacustris]|uniref:VanZ family protein n=1 Tax=Anaerobaca lacustris TaxID=3044600 RepID=A0AAW6TZF2_9BACT|nr:VanZ family protein [Sedimentisphaerales bacterium M17dextr]
MATARRRKVIILLLALYWPVLFVLTHIPVPPVVRQANMSDKGLHFLVYAILTFLLWSVVRPYSKVNWRRATGWLVLAGVIAYGLCDEGLQYFVPGRSADARDLVANATGAIFALTVLTLFSFWPAATIITALTVSMLPVLARRNLMSLLPVLMTAFYVGGYALFTFLWLRHLHPWTRVKKAGRVELLLSVSVPSALLFLTKLSTWVAGRPFQRWDMVAATAGILTGVLVAWRIGWPSRRETAEDSLAPAEG